MLIKCLLTGKIYYLTSLLCEQARSRVDVSPQTHKRAHLCISLPTRAYCQAHPDTYECMFTHTDTSTHHTRRQPLTHKHTGTQACTYMHAHVDTPSHLHTSLHTPIHAHTNKHTSEHAPAHTHLDVRMCTCGQTRALERTCLQTHRYVCAHTGRGTHSHSPTAKLTPHPHLRTQTCTNAPLHARVSAHLHTRTLTGTYANTRTHPCTPPRSHSPAPRAAAGAAPRTAPGGHPTARAREGRRHAGNISLSQQSAGAKTPAQPLLFHREYFQNHPGSALTKYTCLETIHRITEWSGLEGTSVGHLVQPLC